MKVILSRPMMELCLRYREMKLKFLGERPADAQFFENADGKGLSDMRLTSGSLLDKFAKVCNLSAATVNTFRRSSENNVQDSPVLKKDVKKLHDHSQKVAVTNYHRKDGVERGNYIVQLNSKEGVKVDAINDEVVLRKRKMMDDAEKGAAIARAKKVLFDDKIKKNIGKGKVRA